MNNNVYDLRNQVDFFKRENRRILLEMEQVTLELERMKRIYENKGKCKNCSSGCPASEVNGYPCSKGDE